MFFDQNFFASVIPEAQFIGNMPSNPVFVTDSRKLTGGQIFIALKGSKIDAHDLIPEVISMGAAGIVIDKSNYNILDKINPDIKNKLFVVIVDNPESTLIKLATKWREKFNIPIVGITGSIGKTSTKEMLSNICACAGLNFLSTRGNQNTAVLVSLSILQLNSAHKLAIIEMGISKIGEMSLMVQIVKPTIAIITYIGHSHMQGLGSLQGIADEKREIFKCFKDSNIGIINGDQAVLSNFSYSHPVIKFGYRTTNQIQARKLNIDGESSNFILKVYNNKYNIILNTNHEGRVLNALACASAAHVLGIQPEYMIKGITQPLNISGRFHKRTIKDGFGQIINDAYNASPESMKAALSAFDKIHFEGQKVAILGDMLELGPSSRFWHRHIGRFLHKVPSIKRVILVGDNMAGALKTVPDNIQFEHVGDWQEALGALKNYLTPNSLVLVKASNGIQLQKLVEEISI